jgi:hypothetical protein
VRVLSSLLLIKENKQMSHLTLSERKQNICKLQNEINKHHKSDLTLEQVEHWVGSDASMSEIIDNCYEVKMSSGKEGVTPDDILDLCEDSI